MPTRTPSTVTTLEQLRALPDDGLRHEMLDGEHVVTPSPRPVHQLALRELAAWFRTALLDLPHLQDYFSPSDVQLGERTMVQPDLFVISGPPGPPPQSWSEIGTPVLAVEILSPTTAARDRGIKKRLYREAGVAEYWIVDIEARLIERWTPEDERPEVCDVVLRWTVPGSERGVDLDVQGMFQRVLDGGAS